MSKANTHKHIESETMALAKGKRKEEEGLKIVGWEWEWGENQDRSGCLQPCCNFQMAQTLKAQQQQRHVHVLAAFVTVPARRTPSSISRFRRTPSVATSMRVPTSCNHKHATKARNRLKLMTWQHVENATRTQHGCTSKRTCTENITDIISKCQ